MAKSRASRVQENAVTTEETSYRIREGKSPVRIRAAADISSAHVDGKYLGPGVFEVDKIEQGPGSKTGWGHLANGEGWVALDFVEFVK